MRGIDVVASDVTAIEDHAIVGDCRSAALIARDGSVDWMCWPRFDSEPLFGALLDPKRGGSWRIGPRAPLRAERRYLPDTNVLITTFQTESGTVELTDLMPVTPAADARTELVSEHELLRGITCLRGEVDVELRFDAREEHGAQPVPLERSSVGWRGELARGVIILRSDAPDARLEHDGEALRGVFRMREGDRAWWSLTYAHDGPAVLPALGDAAAGRVDRTSRWWRSWCERMSYGGRHAEAVRRSALVLRLMFYSPSGAVIAAPTTSLPERIGGDSNWDYRFCWLRDAALTVRALAGLGYREEAEAFVSWLLHSTRLTRPEVRPLYTVFGEMPAEERELSLEGYRGSRPVRVGNRATEQLQLDVYGELVEGVTLLLRDRKRLDRETRSMLTDLGEFVCRNWERADAGIWEERGPGHEHTLSRALCWIALERIIELQDRGLLPHKHRELFEGTRHRIRQAVVDDGWSDEAKSYLERTGDPAIDAGLLLVGWYGFEDPSSPRMRSTVDRIQQRLGAGRGLIYRRRDREWPGEGAFLACSFWLVDVLARGGRREEANALFDELLEHGNDLGLFAEELDPGTGQALGNFPQALTHLGVINAALTLAEAPS